MDAPSGLADLRRDILTLVCSETFLHWSALDIFTLVCPATFLHWSVPRHFNIGLRRDIFTFSITGVVDYFGARTKMYNDITCELVKVVNLLKVKTSPIYSACLVHFFNLKRKLYEN